MKKRISFLIINILLLSIVNHASDKIHKPTRSSKNNKLSSNKFHFPKQPIIGPDPKFHVPEQPIIGAENSAHLTDQKSSDLEGSTVLNKTIPSKTIDPIFLPPLIQAENNYDLTMDESFNLLRKAALQGAADKKTKSYNVHNAIRSILDDILQTKSYNAKSIPGHIMDDMMHEYKDSYDNPSRTINRFPLTLIPITFAGVIIMNITGTSNSLKFLDQDKKTHILYPVILRSTTNK